jgi:hypothetical protein
MSFVATAKAIVGTSIGKKGTGWKPNKPDSRDRVFTPAGPHARVLLRYGRSSNVPALENFVPAAWDQGFTSRCTGFGTGLGIVSLMNICGFSTASPSSIPSVNGIYTNGRLHTLLPGEKLADDGAYPRSVVQMIARHGAPTEAAFPSTVARVNAVPSFAQLQDGYRFAGLRYEHITETGREKIRALRTALLEDVRPVGFGMQVTPSYERWRGGPGAVWRPAGIDRDTGGHWQLAIGFSEDLNAVLVANSWGTSWGNSGWCWIDADVFAERARDLTVFRDFRGVMLT